jgi:hypothetical protein
MSNNIKTLCIAATLLATSAGVASAEINFYGYVKADFIYDNDFILGNNVFGFQDAGTGSANAPVAGESFFAHATQSRLGLDFGHEDVSGRLEGDFNASVFRLRHAYGEFGNLLVGQTWTNFMPLHAYPDTADFQGPAGITFARVAQVRYTFDNLGPVDAAVSIEQNANSGSQDPVLTASAFYRASFADMRAAVLVGETPENTAGNSDTAFGITISGVAALWEGGSVNATYVNGEGIGGYMVFGQANAAGVDVDAAGEAIGLQGFTAQITQEVTNDITLGLAYGYRENDDYRNPNGVTPPQSTEELQTVHVSAFYTPADNVRFIAEYIYAERINFANNEFDNNRAQFSAQFSF